MNTNEKRLLRVRLAVCGVACWGLLGCSESEPLVGEYREWVGDRGPVAAVAPAPAPASGPFSWTTPEGWTDRGASGMRLTTFVVGEHDPEVLCTVSVFPGDTGGVRANLGRWLGQLGLPTDEAALDQLEGTMEVVSTVGGWPASWVDFRSLAKKEGGEKALLGAIVPVNGQTLFVKLSGPLPVLNAEAGRVRALIASLASGGQP